MNLPLTNGNAPTFRRFGCRSILSVCFARIRSFYHCIDSPWDYAPRRLPQSNQFRWIWSGTQQARSPPYGRHTGKQQIEERNHSINISGPSSPSTEEEAGKLDDDIHSRELCVSVFNYLVLWLTSRRSIPVAISSVQRKRVLCATTHCLLACGAARRSCAILWWVSNGSVRCCGESQMGRRTWPTVGTALQIRICRRSVNHHNPICTHVQPYSETECVSE